MNNRTLTDDDVKAIVDAVTEKTVSAPCSASCLLYGLFPDTEAGREREAVFRDFFKVLVRLRNITGTAVVILIGCIVLAVIGGVTWLASAGRINPFKFIGL